MLRSTPISINTLITTDYCQETWWVEFLYVHNWVYFDKQCLAYSWYLQTDMQMFLFTPLLLIPLAIKPIVGFIVAAIIFAISTATNIFLVYHYHWPATQNWFHPTDPDETNIENYGMLMYDSPLIRCQIYIMGMLVGWLLHAKKEVKLHPLVYLSCWAVGLALMLTVLLGLHDQTNGVDIGVFWRAMYSALSRPAWGIGLSIIQLVLSQSKDEVYFENFIDFVITRLVSITAVTFFCAIFWSACFELSFGRVEKLLLSGGRAPRVAKEKVDATAIEHEEKIQQ